MKQDLVKNRRLTQLHVVHYHFGNIMYGPYSNTCNFPTMLCKIYKILRFDTMFISFHNISQICIFVHHSFPTGFQGLHAPHQHSFPKGFEQMSALFVRLLRTFSKVAHMAQAP